MPAVREHYLYVNQDVFKRLICKLLSLGDCYVGFARPDDNFFAQLFRCPSFTTGMCKK